MNALKCWKCSSRSSNFCADPFDPSSINAQQNRSAFTECGTPFGKIGRTSHPVCKKEKTMSEFPHGNILDFLFNNFFYVPVGDNEVISRSCSFEDINALSDSCELTNSPYFCEICATDGCNGAQLIKVSFFALISTLVVGILCN